MTLDENDLKIEVYRSAAVHEGGQTVGVYDTAVRITHIPTGITVTHGDERSQLMNKEVALRELEQKVENYGKDS